MLINASHAATAALAGAGDDSSYTYDNLKPGPAALIVTVLLAVALFLLIRNMRRQVRRIDFDQNAKDDKARTRSHRDTDRAPDDPEDRWDNKIDDGT